MAGKRKMGYHVGGGDNVYFSLEDWDKLNRALGKFGSGFYKVQHYHAEGRNTYSGASKFIVYRDDRELLVKDEETSLFWYFLGVRHALGILPLDEDEVKRLFEEAKRKKG